MKFDKYLRTNSGHDRGCSSVQIPDPSARYINQSKNGASFHSAFLDPQYEN